MAQWRLSLPSLSLYGARGAGLRRRHGAAPARRTARARGGGDAWRLRFAAGGHGALPSGSQRRFPRRRRLSVRPAMGSVPRRSRSVSAPSDGAATFPEIRPCARACWSPIAPLVRASTTSTMGRSRRPCPETAVAHAHTSARPVLYEAVL